MTDDDTNAFKRKVERLFEGVSANEVANYLAREIRGDCPDEPLRYDAATPSACRPPARKP